MEDEEQASRDLPFCILPFDSDSHSSATRVQSSRRERVGENSLKAELSTGRIRLQTDIVWLTRVPFAGSRLFRLPCVADNFLWQSDALEYSLRFGLGS